MIIKKLRLIGYKPLQHGNIKDLELTYTAPVQLLIGSNGSGKSSVLREITPIPASSSDYIKNGSRTIEIEHNGNNYELISDFGGHRVAHSFLKNGEELNTSGTSTVQQELCVSELGYNPTIGEITSLMTKLCTMSKSDRKTLLFSLYPSNLSFILDKHKELCSRIREYRSNLKMLGAMRAEVMDQIIPEDTLQQMRTSRQDLEQQNNQLDRILFSLDKETKELQSRPEYGYNGQPVDANQLRNNLQSCLSKLMAYRTKYPDLFKHEDPRTTSAILGSKLARAREVIQSSTRTAEELKQSLREYAAYADTSIEDELNKATRELAIQQEILNRTIVDDSVPILFDNDLVRFEEVTYPTVLSRMENLADVRDELWTGEKISSVEREIDVAKMSLKQENDTISRLREGLPIVESRYAKQRELLPPVDCNSHCNLRDNFSEVIKRTEKELTELRNQIELHEKKSVELQTTLEALEKGIQTPRSVLPIIKELEHMFSWNNWGDFVLNGKPLVSLLNLNRFTIGLSMNKILTNSKAAKVKRAATAEIEFLQKKIDTLKNTNLPAKELINKTMTEKTIALEKTLHELSMAEETIAKLDDSKNAIDLMVTWNDRIIRTKKDFEGYTQALFLKKIVELNNDAIKQITEVKNGISSKLRGLEDTLSKQNNLLCRLNESILPKIRAVEDILDKTLKVEPALSPTSGIPHQHMVHFVNSILTRTNEIIRMVWGGDLELAYVNENEPFDFTFPAIVNEGSTVPDCSWCSDGQKEIINLAWMFALCQVMKISALYPVKLDEPDKSMSSGNRTRVLEVLSYLIESGHINQLFLVNHHESLYSAFKHSETMCLNPSNIVIPAKFNEHVTIR